MPVITASDVRSGLVFRWRMLAFTVVALTGVPSENVTLGRRWSVNDVPYGVKSQLCARPGSSCPDGLSWVNVSKISDWSILSQPPWLSAGSKLLGVKTLAKSTPKRSTPFGSGVPPGLTRVVYTPTVVGGATETPDAVVAVVPDVDFLAPLLHAVASVAMATTTVNRRDRAFITVPPPSGPTGAAGRA